MFGRTEADKGKPRNVYPDHIEDRVALMNREIMEQLHQMGVNLTELHEVVGAMSKTTLANRIRNGKLTLKDMLLISDYLPFDWTRVVDRARVERDPDRAAQERKAKTEEVRAKSVEAERNLQEDIDGSEFLSMFPGLVK